MDFTTLSEMFPNLSPEELATLQNSHSDLDALIDACVVANNAKILVQAPSAPIKLDYEERETLHSLIFDDLKQEAGPEFPASLKTLLTIIKNLIESPDEPKFRRLSCKNARLKGTLLGFGVGEVIMELIGFEKVLENSGEGDEEVYYLFALRPDLLDYLVATLESQVDHLNPKPLIRREHTRPKPRLQYRQENIDALNRDYPIPVAYPTLTSHLPSHFPSSAPYHPLEQPERRPKHTTFAEFNRREHEAAVRGNPKPEYNSIQSLTVIRNIELRAMELVRYR
mmetsp:Transcript_26309/g.47156  ORF Transcript_26309/g.47156 Transcript_26309/m.47156 type:complete len:282 (+) Transcript_26309:1-846(+)